MNLSIVKLENGCKVVIGEMEGIKSTSLGIGFPIGSVHDPKGKTGISHYIEHMLFKGTKNRTMDEIKEPIEKVGGILNGSTGRESVIYYAKVPHFFSLEALEIMMDMVVNPAFDENEMEKERKVILEEMRMEMDDPYTRVHDIFIQNCWDDGYGRSILGSLEDLKNISRKDLENFHTRFYGVNNLVISMAGRIDVELKEKVFEMVEKMKKASSVCNESKPEYKPKSRFLKEGRRDITQVHVLIGTKAPGKLDDGYECFLIFDTLMGSGMSSRLFRKIREERGLTYNISSEYIPLRRGGLFLIYASTSTDGYRELTDSISKEIDEVKNGKISLEEFEYGKKRFMGELMLSVESTQANMIRIFDNTITYGEPMDLDDWLKRIEHVEYDEFLSTVSEMLKDDWVLSLVGPSDFIEKVKP
ncbi:MAG: hypothetical protein DRP30_00970 [Thermotoga sp.]|nr:MAG: hypothetical protein DRP30_00970 [Thermotoga sp.]